MLLILYFAQVTQEEVTSFQLKNSNGLPDDEGRVRGKEA